MFVPITYNLRSLFVRKTSLLLTVFGIGATVAIVSGVLALQQGFHSMFTTGGREDVAIFLRPGANSEGDSQFSRDRGLKLIKSVPEIELGEHGPVASMEAYLAVLKIRMGTRLAYRIAIDPGVRRVGFPPMMLLTLAENAIKHGLNPSPTGGSIEIATARTGNQLEIRVADTGVGFGVAATGGTGVGLANTRARLHALYGDEAELSLEANAPTGVVAVIRIPCAVAETLPLAA